MYQCSNPDDIDRDCEPYGPYSHLFKHACPRISAGLLSLQAAGEAGPPQQLELDLLVGCGRRGPSAAVARCLGGAGLVWDGRLVVDASYKSNDPAVMGAGPAAKFSR